MFEKRLVCSKCGKAYPAGSTAFRCAGCGGSLEVEFDYSRLKRHFREHTEAMRKRPFSHMKYRELFPVREPINAGEGGTPLVRSRNLEQKLGIKSRIHFKLECQNPTGSFKDRGSSVEVAKALEFMDNGKQKARKAVCASTGNMGASVSAYCGIAGIRCGIVTPRDAAPIKLEQILAYGARVWRIRGDYAAAAEIAERAHDEQGLCLLGDYLYRREGTKSVGFEVAEQMPAADFVFSPVGNGTLLSAMWKALKESKMLKLSGIGRLPGLAGIQASGCSPVAKAFRGGSGVSPARKAKTVAVAIECGDPLDGERALAAIRESKGFAETVTDNEILKARALLAENEGIFAEPAGAVSFAGLVKAAGRGEVPRGSSVVCIVTGHGLKVPYTGVKGRPLELKGGARLPNF